MKYCLVMTSLAVTLRFLRINSAKGLQWDTTYVHVVDASPRLPAAGGFSMTVPRRATEGSPRGSAPIPRCHSERALSLSKGAAKNLLWDTAYVPEVDASPRLPGGRRVQHDKGESCYPKPALRSTQSGFIDSISSNFFAFSQPFNCFSRKIADSMLGVSSK